MVSEWKEQCEKIECGRSIIGDLKKIGNIDWRMQWYITRIEGKDRENDKQNNAKKRK